VPAVEALLPRFEAAHTQVLGVSVDSIHSHANWARDIGGVSFPLLADFHPKGAVAESYGLYLADAGITDRATVIIDKDGIVRHASSVTPSGERNIEELLALCEQIDRDHPGAQEFSKPAGLSAGTRLFVKSGCGFSKTALLARQNLHLEDAIAVANITEDAGAKAELEKLTGKTQVPCLVVDGEPMLESADIVRYLVKSSTALGA
jgi:glutaredoxin